MTPLKTVFFTTLSIALFSCSKSESTTTPTNNNTSPTSTAVPAVYSKIYGAATITNDGTYITIKTKNLPDHKSTYYPTSNALYEAYSGTTFGGFTFNKNPNSIVEQSSTIKIPVNLLH